MQTSYTDSTGQTLTLQGNHSEAAMKAEMAKRRKEKKSLAPSSTDARMNALLQSLVVKA